MAAKYDRVRAELLGLCGESVVVELTRRCPKDGDSDGDGDGDDDRRPAAIVGWVSYIAKASMTLHNAAAVYAVKAPDGSVVRVVAAPGSGAAALEGILNDTASAADASASASGRNGPPSISINVLSAPDAAATTGGSSPPPGCSLARQPAVARPTPCSAAVPFSLIKRIGKWDGDTSECIVRRCPVALLAAGGQHGSGGDVDFSDAMRAAALEWARMRIRRYLSSVHGDSLVADENSPGASRRGSRARSEGGEATGADGADGGAGATGGGGADGEMPPAMSPAEFDAGAEAAASVRAATRQRSAAHAAVPRGATTTAAAASGPLAKQLVADAREAARAADEVAGRQLKGGYSGGCAAVPVLPGADGCVGDMSLSIAIQTAAAQLAGDAEQLRDLAIEAAGWVQALHRPQPVSAQRALLEVQLAFVRKWFAISIVAAIFLALASGILLGASATEIVTARDTMQFRYNPLLWILSAPPGLVGVVLGVQLAMTTDLWSAPTLVARRVTAALEIATALLLLPAGVVTLMYLGGGRSLTKASMATFYSLNAELSDSELCRFQLSQMCTGYENSCVVANTPANGTHHIILYRRDDCPPACPYSRDFVQRAPKASCGPKLHSSITSTTTTFMVLMLFMGFGLVLRRLAIFGLIRYYRQRAIEAVRAARAAEDRFDRLQQQQQAEPI